MILSKLLLFFIDDRRIEIADGNASNLPFELHNRKLHLDLSFPASGVPVEILSVLASGVLANILFVPALGVLAIFAFSLSAFTLFALFYYFFSGYTVAVRPLWLFINLSIFFVSSGDQEKLELS